MSCRHLQLALAAGRLAVADQVEYLLRRLPRAAEGLRGEHAHDAAHEGLRRGRRPLHCAMWAADRRNQAVSARRTLAYTRAAERRFTAENAAAGACVTAAGGSELGTPYIK